MDLSEIKVLQFPGGERHVTVPLLSTQDNRQDGNQFLRAVIRCPNDLIDLLLVADALESRSCKPEKLYLPYIPYARQDRITSPGTAFSLRVAARLINDLSFKQVHVYEPHSDVASALLKNCIIHTQDAEVKQFVRDLQSVHQRENILVLAPDAGASKRVERLGFPEMGQALKHRDPATGHVEVAFVSENVTNRNVLIVDDICDGGATFIQLAKKLYERRAKSVSLFVAHGIFSRGIEVLSDAGICHIGTTTSFCNQPHPGIKIYPVLEGV
ncbi:MAG: ribose-phosphate diphosphokinase [Planctomycetaceae bacterium]